MADPPSRRLAGQLQGCDEPQGYLLGRPVPRDRLVYREAEVAVVLAGEFAALAS